MFDKTPATPAAPAEKASAPAHDIVIHAMPREFYGKEASVNENAKPREEVKPIVPPPVPTPPQPQVMKVANLAPPPAHTAPRRSWLGVVAVSVFFIAVLGVGGYFAYVRVMDAQEQQRQAEEAARKAEDERQQLEEDRQKAEEAARQAALTPTPGKDTDSDGLTDIEELLYGTDPREPDSDKDTFLDGNEVFHRYHPLGDAPATLLDTGAVRELTEALYPYTLFYPSTWSVALDRDNLGVTFKSSRQASILVRWEEKSASLTLADWFAAKDTGTDADEMKETLTKLGYYGLVAENDRTAYLDVGDAVVTMVYDLGEKNQIEYLQTFQMMVNSLEVVEVTE